jgi:hypothetical protein
LPLTVPIHATPRNLTFRSFGALSVRASGPATRPALTILKVLAGPVDPLETCVRPFGGLNPAYSFIARERCKVLPWGQRFRTGHPRRFQIGR